MLGDLNQRPNGFEKTSALDHSAIVPYYILNWKLYLFSNEYFMKFLMFKLKIKFFTRIVGWNQCSYEHWKCVYREQFVSRYVGRTGNRTHHVVTDGSRFTPLGYPVIDTNKKIVLLYLVTFLIYLIWNSVKWFTEYHSVSIEEK